MSSVTFRSIIARHSYEALQACRDAVSRVPLLSSLSTNQLSVLASAMSLQCFPPGAMIISKGSLGQQFFIIKVRSSCLTGSL